MNKDTKFLHFNVETNDEYETKNKKRINQIKK